VRHQINMMGHYRPVGTKGLEEWGMSILI